MKKKYYFIKTMFHKYPAIWLTALFAGASSCAWFLREEAAHLFIPILVINFITLILAIFFYSKPFAKWIYLPLFFAVVLIYFWSRTQFFPINHLSAFSGKNVSSVHGWVSDVNYYENGNHTYTIRCDSIFYKGRMIVAEGAILLRQNSNLRLRYGRELKISARFQKPALPGNPGEFVYRRYLNLQGISWQCFISDEKQLTLLGQNRGNFLKRLLIHPLKTYFSLKIDRYFSGEARAIILALLMGEKQDLSKKIKESFRKSGVIHVLAISGLHVAYLLFVFLILFTILRIPYWYKIFFSLNFLFLFVAMVDFKAPVLRAALMALAYYIGILRQTPGNTLNSVAAVALLLLIYNPLYILDAGFQFSFCAVLGILYGFPRLMQLIPFDTSTGSWRFMFRDYIYKPLLVSLSAVMATTPLTWYYYGTVHPGSIFSNLLVIPGIGLLVILAIIFLMLTPFGIFPLKGLAALITLLFNKLLDIIRSLESLPLMQVELSAPPGWLLPLLFISIYFVLNSNRRLQRILVFYSLALFLFIYLIRTNEPAGKLQVSFVQVGQGDGAIIEFPSGVTVVIDAGDKGFGKDAGRRFMLPFLKRRGIDHINYLVGSHVHSDHIGGFETLLETIKVDTLVLPAYRGESELYQNLLKKAALRGVALSFLGRGDRLHVGADSRCYILHPFGIYTRPQSRSGKEVNNSSLVLKIVHGKNSLLFTGDLELSGEEALQSYGSFLQSTILKVGHHGSKTSSSQQFLEQIKPGWAIISVGRKNRYFHPSRKTVERILGNRIRLHRTDRQGAALFSSDGIELNKVDWRTE